MVVKFNIVVGYVGIEIRWRVVEIYVNVVSGFWFYKVKVSIVVF